MVSAASVIDALTPGRPVCSLCCKEVGRAVAFIARNVNHNGKPSRGTGRRVRLCRPCVRRLALALAKGRR